MSFFVKRITAALLALCLLSSFTALAANTTITQEDLDKLQNKVDSAQQDMEQSKNTLNQNQQDKDATEQKSQQLLEQINNLSNQQTELGNQLVDTQSQMNQKQQEYDTHLEEYKEQLRALQMMHDSGSVALIANVKSFYDLLTFPSILQRISSHSVDILTQLEQEHEELNSLASELDTKKNEVTQNQQELEESRQNYQEHLKNLNQEISDGEAEYEQLKAEYERRKEELEQADALYEEQIRQALEEAAKATPTPAPTPEPTPTPTPEPTPSPTPVATPTPEPSVSEGESDSSSDQEPGVTPSPTPVATPTPTPAPTASPTPTPQPSKAPDQGVSMVWPLPGYSRLSSYFGEIRDFDTKPHYAIDIPAPAKTPIRAAESGTVLLAGYSSSYGYWALINHRDGLATVYAHMSAGTLAISAGQTVTKGQYIGGVGSTGFSTGNHLHFEVRLNGTKVDPLNYVSP